MRNSMRNYQREIRIEMDVNGRFPAEKLIQNGQIPIFVNVLLAISPT